MDDGVDGNSPMPPMLRVVIAGGGTGGHTSAGLAIAAALRQRLGDGVELLWVGSRRGVEAQAAPRAGIPYQAIATGKLRRAWTAENLVDLFIRVPAGLGQALGVLRRFSPNVVVATGGFVAVPTAVAAWLLRVPVLIHEQTAVSGLANRLTARLARLIAVTFPASARHFPPGKMVVTGNPVRPELLRAERSGAAGRLGLDPALPLVYVTGGAQGAHRINRAVGEALPRLLGACQLVHQCGENVYDDHGWLAARARGLAEPLRGRYRLLPFVGEELADIYAAASLVVGRAGAGTVNELCHLGLPALLIPLPGAADDEQTANARLLVEARAAVLLPDAELSPERLAETVLGLLGEPARLKSMGEQARALARPDAAERLVELILDLARTR